MIEKQEFRNLISYMSKELIEIEYMQKLFYIFTLIFFKVTSDTWIYKEKEYKEKYPNHMERVNRLMRNQPILIEKKWDYIYNAISYPKLGEVLNDYIIQLAIKNSYLYEICLNCDFRKIEYRNLLNIIETLNKESLEIKSDKDSKLLADVLDEVLMEHKWVKDLYKGNAGNNFTPKGVIQLLTRLSKIKENQKIADLVCGSGGLLIEACNMVKDRKCEIYGQENNKDILEFCKLNMLLHGICDAKINLGNTILDQNYIEKFDVIVANPPFSTSNSIKRIAEEEPDLFYYRGKYPYGIPPASKADYAFIQNMLQALKETGRMSTIIALGALSRVGAEEQIRKNMVKDNVVDSIILLPQNLFRNTLIKTCIMVLDKNKVQSDILFIDASNEFEKGKLQNKIGEKNLKHILEYYERRENIESISYVATQQEVLENNANLSVNKYVEERKKEINLRQIEMKIKDVEEQLKIVKDKKKFYFYKLNKELKEEL